MMTATNASPGLMLPGDFAPWFKAPVFEGRPDWVFNSVGGINSMVLFMGSAALPQVKAALDAVLARRELFNETRALFFGVTVTPDDAAHGRLPDANRDGIRYFLDYDRAISTLYGAGAAGSDHYRPHILILDRALRIYGRYALSDIDHALDVLAADPSSGRQDWAPVIAVPDLLEPDFCRALMDLYDRDGGEPSGFMREVDGKTRLVTDEAFKQRRDAHIADPALREALVTRIRRRLVPAIQRSFQFEATRIERYIVSAYDAGAGHFSPHRDNTTKGTAHRRFAVSINLNDGYDGGDLRMPEFGARTYRAPPGGAIVFSCSLLHEATPVTRGRRYACLPFLYDDAAAKIREHNNAFLDEGVHRYTGAAAGSGA